ncbi:MAG: 30S ribosomal protein S6 [Oscillospiraceae bacterium]|jgi:small subunit ribosomal protein S6|nr:30S ribosomal protein S6 [Oscillospiraceae bacterium]
MEEIKNSYETVFILSTKLDEQATAALVAKFKDLITANNGTVDGVDEWGKRRLAYAINKETEGYYVLINFTSVPAFTAELDRIFKITDGVIRSLIIRKDA